LKRKKNSDGDAFIAGEPLVHGPFSNGTTRYNLAWSMETTPVCNGPRDTRRPERTGSILIRTETGELLDTDCDNATPVREVVIDHRAMFDIVPEATPALRFELCRHYIAPDLSSGVCETDSEKLREIKDRMLEY
jgi:hypothetical protein